LPVRFEVNADTTGLEHLVVIAVKGKGPPVEFSALAQPTIEQAKSRAGAGEEGAMDSALGQLFQNALFAKGTTRSATRTQVNNYQMQLMSLRVSSKMKQ